MRMMRPMEGFALVRILPRKPLYDSPIIMPDKPRQSAESMQDAYKDPIATKPEPQVGIVESLGRFRIKNGLCYLPPFGIGAKVLILGTSGKELRRNPGEKLRVVKTEEIVALLEDVP